jgi:hypothetical protein
MWAVSFLVALLIDQIFMECFIVAGKIIIYPWVKSNTAGGNMIAHLLFFFIAAPEMEEFFFE